MVNEVSKEVNLFQFITCVLILILGLVLGKICGLNWW